MYNIISENGNDYLQSYIAKINNNTIDASGFFVDLAEFINTMNIDTSNRDSYGSFAAAIYNKFNASYISPSFMNSFNANPALCLYESAFVNDYDVNSAATLGSTFHKIMEEYYKQDPINRDQSKLLEFKKDYILPGQDVTKINEFISGYVNIYDYLNPTKKLDDTTLKCQTEHSNKADIIVRSCNHKLPCKVKYIVDRIDYRDNDIYILDYKTGRPKPDANTFNGHLAAMLLYKWGIENEYNIDVTGGFLITPTNSTKYMKLDYSKSNEEKLIEKIELFYEKFAQSAYNRIYTYTDNGFFYGSKDKQVFKEIMNDSTIWMAKIPVKICLGKTEDRLKFRL